MKVSICFAGCAVPALLFALGCGSDPGMIDPPTRGDGTEPSLASERHSVWSAPRNLDPENSLHPVNSPFTDQQPALSRDGLSLYFASNRSTDPSDGVLDQNIWVAQRDCTDPDQCSWSDPVVLGVQVNGSSLDVSPTLSRDGHQLFFASQRPHSHCSTPPPCTNRDLWVSYRADVHDNFGWQDAVNLGDGINSPDEEIAPSYFENEDGGVPQLFFNRGAVGGDIYMSEMRNGVWSSPREVEELNTGGTDQRPSISHDGLEIYFYSDRDPDRVNRLWVATRQSVSGSWSTPVSVAFPTSEQAAIMPFIHSHGRTETLLFVRPFSLAERDIWITERRLLGSPE